MPEPARSARVGAERLRAAGDGAGFGERPAVVRGYRGQIDSGRPIETGIYWTAGGGHAQVIYGYDPSTQAISYGDPWPTSPRYSEMYYSSYVSNSQFQWGQALSGMSG